MQDDKPGYRTRNLNEWYEAMNWLNQQFGSFYSKYIGKGIIPKCYYDPKGEEPVEEKSFSEYKEIVMRSVRDRKKKE